MTEHDEAGGASLRRDILTTLMPGFRGIAAPEWLLARLRDGLGGVCVFAGNIASPEQLAGLTGAIREANPDAVVAIDEEGGDVTRLFARAGSPYPGNAVLGRIDDVGLTERVGRSVGEALAATGCTMDFAPDADINSNAANPVIGVRSFGAEPGLVARHTAAWIRGLQTAGVDAAAKHFPGHGDTSADSHLALPVVDLPLEALQGRELVPFRAAVAAGTRAIMTSHILLPQLDAVDPATLSSRVLHRLLRDELGYEGVVVSDALDMHGASGAHGIPEAAVRALAAGCDLLCIGANNTDEQLADILDAVYEAIDDGRLAAEDVARAAGRVRGLPGHPGADAPAAAGLAAGAAVLEAEILPRATASIELGDACSRIAGAGRVGTVVRIDTIANIAVGDDVPWGVFAASAPGDWVDEADVVPLSEREPGGRAGVLGDPAGLAGPVLVIGKDLHRYPFAREAIDALRAVRGDVLAIDMGWPGEDRAYADVASFGASRLMGRAVIDRLREVLDPAAVQ
ncbi:glycoside hydrolase family 3 N-terminal domain-containing protein [Agromyces archimandritae]|uniref:Glycoside hydrolase family 3 N-terminal domain-containing protein n=1 Tax=Agromyces archimandritae TaxID=2781962 RepID=A0A975FLH6_9MICO|nr:glycoside hydrolase family 3 N-terminal domain-containing protein [Agromyces archimandritae]QTX03932.1 hypothetical protein G127AT_11525 [Agromyces archimandritae]